MTTTVSKSTSHTTLVQMKYTGQQIYKYVMECESCSVQLGSIDAPMDEEILVPMFTESFGDHSESPYGMDPSALVTKKA